MLPEASTKGGAAPLRAIRHQRATVSGVWLSIRTSSAPAAMRLRRSSSRLDLDFDVIARERAPRRPRPRARDAARQPPVIVLDQDLVEEADAVVRPAAVARPPCDRTPAAPARSSACRGCGSPCPPRPRRSAASRSRSRTCAGEGSRRRARPSGSRAPDRRARRASRVLPRLRDPAGASSFQHRPGSSSSNVAGRRQARDHALGLRDDLGPARAPAGTVHSS